MPAERPRGGWSDARAPGSTEDRVQRAADALAEARADARGRGDLPAGLRGRPGPGQTDEAERAVAIAAGIGDAPASGPASGGRTGGSGRGRPRREDPQRLELAIGGLLDQQGWQEQAAIGSVFGRWAEIVGADLAAHTRPDSFADGELAVIADSTAWATQVRLLAPQLIRRLAAELGDGTVRRVKVRGPQAPRTRGGWRVPGSKGPGDTYG
jgi:predicted nucleic acid-binding Zn ribbon protein